MSFGLLSQVYNCHIITAIAGLAIVVSGLWLLIRDLSSVDSAYSHSAADAAVKYERDAAADIKERCLTPAGLGEIDCASKADEAKREGQRKEHDLAAQNITAWWTKVMGIAALIGMALSAVGVWLVKTTFDETRESNIIARNTMISDNRAWIKLSILMKPLHVTRDCLTITNMMVVAENVGHSVAKDVRCWASLHVGHFGTFMDESLFDRTPPQFFKVQQSQNIWPQNEHNFQRDAWGLGVVGSSPHGETYRVFLRAVAEYRTIFDANDAEPRTTEYILELDKPDGAAFIVENDRNLQGTEVFFVGASHSNIGSGRIT